MRAIASARQGRAGLWHAADRQGGSPKQTAAQNSCVLGERAALPTTGMLSRDHPSRPCIIPYSLPPCHHSLCLFRALLALPPCPPYLAKAGTSAHTRGERVRCLHRGHAAVQQRVVACRQPCDDMHHLGCLRTLFPEFVSEVRFSQKKILFSKKNFFFKKTIFEK